MNWAKETSEGVILNLRIVPRADRNKVQGVMGDALKMRIQAPPVEGKANEALIRFLADRLDVPARAIRILSGETGRNKRVLIAGSRASRVEERLAPDGNFIAP